MENKSLQRDFAEKKDYNKFYDFLSSRRDFSSEFEKSRNPYKSSLYLLATGIVSLVFLGSALSSGNQSRIECETYRGYHGSNANGVNYLIFDSQKEEDRKFKKPKYQVIGNPEGLIIGEEYSFDLNDFYFSPESEASNLERCE